MRRLHGSARILPAFPGLLAFPPVALNLVDGNIHLFLAVAIALGFRYPALWSVVLLTKVTPGVGLLWFAVRREWRSLRIALGVTGAIVAVDLRVHANPVDRLGSDAAANSAGTPPPWPALPIPLWLRLPDRGADRDLGRATRRDAGPCR